MRKSSLVVLTFALWLLLSCNVLAKENMSDKTRVKITTEEFDSIKRKIDTKKESSMRDEKDSIDVPEISEIKIFDSVPVNVNSDEDIEQLWTFIQRAADTIKDIVKQNTLVKFILETSNETSWREVVLEQISWKVVVEREVNMLTDEENILIDRILDIWTYDPWNSPSDINLENYIKNNQLRSDGSGLQLELMNKDIKKAKSSKSAIKYVTSVWWGKNLTDYVKDFEWVVVDDQLVLSLKSKWKNDKEILDIIDFKIDDIKNNYNYLGTIQENLEWLWYVPWCEPANNPELASDWYKYAQIDNQWDYTVPCSKRRFLEYVDNQKRQIVGSLLESQKVYKENYDRLWNKTVIAAKNQRNTVINEDWTTSCLNEDGTESFDLWMWCVNVKSLKLWGLAYWSDVWVVVLDPFKCNDKPTNTEVITCKESNNSFRIVNLWLWKIWLSWMVYSSEYWPIMFDIWSLEATIDTLED